MCYPPVLGDPALLLPLIVKGNDVKCHKIGIIPHHSETELIKENFGRDYPIIDLRTNNVEDVILKITSCERILSTSLHGIIVSHAYKIPALWVKNNYIGTDGFKFYDYFSSVDIPQYSGFENLQEVLKDVELLFRENKILSIPNKPLKDIQKALLESFPYPLAPDIKSLLISMQ